MRLGAHEVVVSKNAAEMQKHAGSFDFILDTVSAAHDLNAYLDLLKRDGTLTLVGAPEKPLPVAVFSLLFGRRRLAARPSAASAETQEMLDFCAEHGITADIELIPIQKINEAYERLLKSDVKYRFVIDMASLKHVGPMTNRFRVPSTLPRKLEELGVSPADVLRHGGSADGAVRPGEDPGQHRGVVRPLSRARGSQPRSGHRAQAGDGGSGRALRPDRHRGAVGAVVPGRPAAAGALQAAHLPGRDTRGGAQATNAGVQFGWLLAQESEPALLVDLCFAWVVAHRAPGDGRARHSEAPGAPARGGAAARCTKRISAVR